MKQRPIIFSSPMIQAILEGRKTQTRRVIKPQPNQNGVSYMKNPPLDWESIYRQTWCPWKWETEDGETISKFCPHGQIGDLLYVRETWQAIDFDCDGPFTETLYRYRADNPDPIYECDGDGFSVFNKDGSEKTLSWKPSIHMPKEAARIWLRITDVAAEKIGDITEKDAVAEGVKRYPKSPIYGYMNYLYPDQYCLTAVESFRTLWESIYGPDSWNPDTWVWKITFEQIERP